MSIEFGEYQKTETPNKSQLNSQSKNLNDNYFDNYKLSNKKNSENANLSPNNDALLDTNPTIASKNNTSATQNVLPKEIQNLPGSEVQQKSEKKENSENPNENFNPNLSGVEINSSLKNDGKISVFESKAEPIENYIVQSPTDSFENQPEVNPINEEENNNQNEEKQGKSDVFINDDENNKVENQFAKLKVTKTKYLSKEELAQLTNNESEKDENDNNNNDNQNPTNSNAFAQNENINNENLGNTNMNNEEGEEKIADTNILGSNEFIKMAETKYAQDNNNEANNELNQEPTHEKQFSNAHNIKVLKIEDEENIQICPDFISGFLNKWFG